MSTATTAPPTHLELLRLVRELQAAAASSNAPEISEVVQRLRAELEEHVAAERQDYAPLPNQVVEALSSGQQRLLSLVDGLDRENCQTGAKPCVVRVAELAALLRRQASMEQRATGLLDRHLGPSGEDDRAR